MNNHCNQSSQSAIFLTVSACLTLIFMSSCSVADPEYSKKLTSAQTQCRGHEILGVWISKVKAGESTLHSTMMFSANGTGRLMMIPTTRGRNANPIEYHATWKYAGNGLWRAYARDVRRMISQSLTSVGALSPGPPLGDIELKLRYTDHEILSECKGDIYNLSQIFVRADHTLPVEKHYLINRR
jgi:hypothetical protein